MSDQSFWPTFWIAAVVGVAMFFAGGVIAYGDGIATERRLWCQRVLAESTVTATDTLYAARTYGCAVEVKP